MSLRDIISDWVSVYPARHRRRRRAPEPLMPADAAGPTIGLTEVPGMTWRQLDEAAAAVRDATTIRSVFHPNVIQAVAALQHTAPDVVALALARSRAVGIITRAYGGIFERPNSVSYPGVERAWMLELDNWDLVAVVDDVIDLLAEEGVPAELRRPAAQQAIGEFLALRMTSLRFFRRRDWAQYLTECHNRRIWGISYRSSAAASAVRPTAPRPLSAWDDDLVWDAVEPLTAREQAAALLFFSGMSLAACAAASGVQNAAHLERVLWVACARHEVLHGARYWAPVLLCHLRIHDALSPGEASRAHGPSRRWAHSGPREVIDRCVEAVRSADLHLGDALRREREEIRAALQAVAGSDLPGVDAITADLFGDVPDCPPASVMSSMAAIGECAADGAPGAVNPPG